MLEETKKLWREGLGLHQLDRSVTTSLCNNAGQNDITDKKIPDWAPNCYKTAEAFPKYSAPHHSMSKLTPNESATTSWYRVRM